MKIYNMKNLFEIIQNIVENNEYEMYFDDTALASNISNTQIDDIFISYCWKNSKLASSKDSIGQTDPRSVAKILKQDSLKVWLDIEKLGRAGLFEELANGIISCKLFIAFISAQYVASKNCMRELNFAVMTLNKPFIPVIVGEGENWKQSAAAFIISDAFRFDFSNGITTENLNDFKEKIKQRLL